MLRGIAESVGLDGDAFEAFVRSDEAKRAIKASRPASPTASPHGARSVAADVGTAAWVPHVHAAGQRRPRAGCALRGVGCFALRACVASFEGYAVG